MMEQIDADMAQLMAAVGKGFHNRWGSYVRAAQAAMEDGDTAQAFVTKYGSMLDEAFARLKSGHQLTEWAQLAALANRLPFDEATQKAVQDRFLAATEEYADSKSLIYLATFWTETAGHPGIGDIVETVLKNRQMTLGIVETADADDKFLKSSPVIGYRNGNPNAQDVTVCWGGAGSGSVDELKGYFERYGSARGPDAVAQLAQAFAQHNKDTGPVFVQRFKPEDARPPI